MLKNTAGVDNVRLMESSALLDEIATDAPPEFMPPVGIVIFDPAQSFNFALSEAGFERHRQFLLANVADKADSYQCFIRNYFDLDAPPPNRQQQCLNRYAFNLEVLRQVIPDNGAWLDVGAFGNDAIRLQQLKPIRDLRLISFEGGVVSIDDKGLHHGKGAEAVEIERLDIERAALPILSETMDVVSAFEILEHFKFGPQNFVMECNRVLVDGGLLVLSTPNINSAKSISLSMQGESPYECRVYHRSLDFGRVHPLEYDYPQLYTLFIENGFEVLSFISVSFSPLSKTEETAIKLCSELNNAIPGSQKNHHFGAHWYMILRKTKNIKTFTYPPALFE